MSYVQSKDWDLSRFYEVNASALGLEDNWDLYRRRASFSNQAVQDVLDQVWPLVEPAYLASEVLAAPGTAKRSTTSTGTWTAATRTLVFTGMSADFGSEDIGKLITIRIGDDLYLGTIESVLDGDTVTVKGASLPEDDDTVDEVQVLPTTPTGTTVDISSLRILRSAQARITLQSTELEAPVHVVSPDDLIAWRSDDLGTPDIVFSLEGSTLRFRTRLDTVGTLTLTFVELPEEMVDDDDPVPLPDGGAITLASMRLQKLLAKEAKIVLPDYAEELKQTLAGLAGAFKAAVTEEELKTKIAALT
jgi:hypothetical protein